MRSLSASALACACALALGLGGALAAAPPPAAASQSFVCPAQVRLNAATATVSPAAPGFTPLVSDAPLPLTGASAFNGPPEEGAALKPASERRGAAGSTAVWRFERSSGSSHEVSINTGKWMSCDYAQGLVRLTVQVHADTKNCEARTVPAKAAGRVSVLLACQ